MSEVEQLDITKDLIRQAIRSHGALPLDVQQLKAVAEVTAWRERTK